MNSSTATALAGMEHHAAPTEALLFVLTCIAIGISTQFFITPRLSFLPYTAILLVRCVWCGVVCVFCFACVHNHLRAPTPLLRRNLRQVIGLAIGLLQGVSTVPHAFTATLSQWMVRLFRPSSIDHLRSSLRCGS
jgi:hypothetical protein